MEPVGGTARDQGRRRACSRRPTRICRPRSAPGGSARTSTSASTSSRSSCRRCATRQEDIPLLADHFMAEFAREYGRRPKTLRRRRRDRRCSSYRWPGNVRELRNVIERLMIMVPGDAISAARPQRSSTGGAAAADAPAERRAAAAAARGARSLRARLHPAHAGRAAGQHVAHGRRARRRAQQPLPQDAGVRHRAGAAREGRAVGERV